MLELVQVLVKVGEGAKYATVDNVDHTARVNIAPVKHGSGGTMEVPCLVAFYDGEGAEHVLRGGAVGMRLDGCLHCSQFY